MSGPNQPAKTRLELELELDADPIRGEIRDPDGSRSPFRGWIELIGALERLRGPHAEAWGEAKLVQRQEEG